MGYVTLSQVSKVYQSNIIELTYILTFLALFQSKDSLCILLQYYCKLNPQPNKSSVTIIIIIAERDSIGDQRNLMIFWNELM